MGTELFQYDIYNHIPELMEKVPARHLWINRFRLLFNNTKEKIKAEPDVVISDIRFPHEARTIKKMGGFLIRVIRPSLTNEDSHPSEQEQEKIHNVFKIMNDGTIAELYKKVDKYIKKTQERCNDCGKETESKGKQKGN